MKTILRHIYIVIILLVAIISRAEEPPNTTVISKSIIESDDDLTSVVRLKFEAKVDPYLSVYTDYMVDLATEGVDFSTSKSVGSTQGTFNVSAAGTATYNIPIKPAPGLKGMTPNISITYNSNGGQGIAGLGWNISGISVITASVVNNIEAAEAAFSKA